MFNRAMKKLKGEFEQKGLQPEESVQSNNFDLLHFHIEAFDDQI